MSKIQAINLIKIIQIMKGYQAPNLPYTKMMKVKVLLISNKKTN